MFKDPSVPVFSIARFLYTQNPFYLIGTMLVLFGLQQSLGREPQLATNGLLTALLTGYTFFLAGIAAVVIRWGQIWDDARTILLVIVLMFFMLSASLDVHLVTEPVSGTLLLALSLALSIALSEGLLRGLRIHLAPRYRLPYYLLLTLLFVYPAVPAWLAQFGLVEARPWVLFAFPWLAGAALLSLLPAARAPAKTEPASGTPWKWPYFPWSLFVYLSIGIAIRSWWLTISFEPASGQDAYFRPYFLLPICLAWSALVLEIGRTRASRGALVAGMLLPLAGLAMAFPGPGASPVEVAFLGNLSAMLGSPAQLAVGSMLAFYAWTWLRGVRAAEGFLILVGLMASLIGRDTLDWNSLSSPQALPLAAVAAGLTAVAAIDRSTWRALAAGILICGGLRYAPLPITGADAWFWQWHAPAVALLALTTLLNDDLAKWLRQIAWRAAPAMGLIAALIYPWALPQLSVGSLSLFLALLLATSAALWLKQREPPQLAAVVMTLAANGLAHFPMLYRLIGKSALAAGLPWLAVGLTVVLVALGISLAKMGIWHSARKCLMRLNMALGGSVDKAT
ncbi:MAG: hypothetical protein L0211_13595 [Planctomycetaceae bacterium]|nr:hypothetical protein [Planctomycetaceae bacterium]